MHTKYNTPPTQLLPPSAPLALPNLDGWRANGRWLAFRGLRIFTVAYGQGPTVLALHAFPTASYDYARIVPLLVGQFRVVMLDFPGFGFSDKPRHFTYSLLTYADAVEAVVAAYGVTRVYLLAHDIGASVGLELLRRSTLLVDRFVMMNASVQASVFTNLLISFWRPLLLNPLLGPLTGRLRLLRRPIFARMIDRLFASGLTRAEMDAFWSLLRYNDGIAIYHQLLRYMPERRVYGDAWIDALATHPVPLTLIWGQADPIAVPAIAESVLARRPGAYYVPLTGVGHYPHWEAPDHTAAAIMAAFAS